MLKSFQPVVYQLKIVWLGISLITMQRLVGHDDLATTSRYDRMGEKTKRQAAERLIVQYFAGKVAEVSVAMPLSVATAPFSNNPVALK